MDPNPAAEHVSLLFDQEHNVHTHDDVAVGDLAIGTDSARFAERYGPTPELTFRTIISQLDLDLASYTFFDFGAGKGRTMFLAAEYPFAKIVGVELAPKVYQVGLRNIQTFQSASQRCFDLELIEGDAVDVELPTGSVVYFLYAPFHGPVMYRRPGSPRPLDRNVLGEPRRARLKPKHRPGGLGQGLRTPASRSRRAESATVRG